jgi:hypothetical protein
MWCGVSAINPKESDMNATAALPVAGIDLSKTVFQLAVADGSWRVIASPFAYPVRALVRQSRSGPDDHGSVRFRSLLGPMAQ